MSVRNVTHFEMLSSFGTGHFDLALSVGSGSVGVINLGLSTAFAFSFQLFILEPTSSFPI